MKRKNPKIEKLHLLNGYFCPVRMYSVVLQAGTWEQLMTYTLNPYGITF